jgi:hypothetical protein
MPTKHCFLWLMIVVGLANTNAQTCDQQWTIAADTNVPGGTYYLARDPAACRSACYDSPMCTGIDWDPNNPSGQKCWLSGNGPNATAFGVQHHFLNRNINCGCSPKWARFQNTNVAGGSAAPATNLSACQSACISSPTCLGIDWDPDNPQGIKCFLTSDGLWNNGTSLGVTHYALDRNLNCQACTVRPSGLRIMRAEV